MEGLHNMISTHAIIQTYVAIDVATDMYVNVIIYGFKMARLSNESNKRVVMLHIPLSQFTVDFIVLSP